MNKLKTYSMKKTFLLSLLLTLLGTISAWAQAPVATAEEAITGLLNRIGGNGAADKFEIVIDASLAENSQDVFVITSQNGKPCIKGNTQLSVATGINWYLNHHAHINLTWNNLTTELSQVTLPVPTSEEKHVCNAPYRYDFNTCTFSYSMAFWTWERWQKEIDWMALHGINAPLNLVGLDVVTRKFLRELGVSENDINAYIAGPGFIAWFAMNNLEGWGGTINAKDVTMNGNPDWWYTRQEQLCRNMLQRMRELGMQPVIPGFSGQVPNCITKYTIKGFSSGDVINNGTWAGGYTRPDILKPSTESYRTFAAVYYKHLHEVMGVSEHYSMDPFHEGNLPAGVSNENCYPNIMVELDKYHTSVSAEDKAKNNVDEQPKWMIQYWQGVPQSGAFSAMSSYGDRFIGLDLFADNIYAGNAAKWRTDYYQGRPYVYCMLHNFGGRSGMHGRLETTMDGYFQALAKNNNCQGIGATPEGTETNPILYDMLFELPWMDVNNRPTADEWLEDYAYARYGVHKNTAPQSLSALQYLKESVWNCQRNQQGTSEAIILGRPRWTFGDGQRQNGTSLEGTSVSSWSVSSIYWDTQFVLQAADDLYAIKDLITTEDGRANFDYDFIDVVRQSMVDQAAQLLPLIKEARNSGNNTEYERLYKMFLQLMLDLDEMLSYDENFKLERWTSLARNIAGETAVATLTNVNDRNWLEWNARTQVTVWSNGNNGLNDYSNRCWAGLIKDYHYPRWKYFFENNGGIKDGNWFTSEKAWTVNFTDYDYSTVTIPGGKTATEKAAETFGNYFGRVKGATKNYIFPMGVTTNATKSGVIPEVYRGQTVELPLIIGKNVTITSVWVDLNNDGAKGNGETLTATDNEVAIPDDATIGKTTAQVVYSDGTDITFNIALVEDISEARTVTVVAGSTNGSVAIEGTNELSITNTEAVKMTATANTGFNFYNWTKDSEVVSNDNPFIYYGKEAATFTANFIQDKWGVPTEDKSDWSNTTVQESFVNQITFAYHNREPETIYEASVAPENLFNTIPQIINVPQGASFDISWSDDNNNGLKYCYLSAYYDYDGDGVFELLETKGKRTPELANDGSNNLSVCEGKINVLLPYDAPLGITHMRLRFDGGWKTQNFNASTKAYDAKAQLNRMCYELIINVTEGSNKAAHIVVESNNDEWGTAEVWTEETPGWTASNEWDVSTGIDVKMKATKTSEDVEFLGWYDHYGRLLTTELAYSMKAREDATYTAKFRKALDIDGWVFEYRTQPGSDIVTNKLANGVKPEAGKTYYIYAPTRPTNDGEYVNRYLYNNSGTLTLSTTESTAASYLWKCGVENGKYTFQNVADPTKYLKHKGLANAPYGFELGTGTTYYEGITMQSVPGDGETRNLFFVINDDGSDFNQSTIAHNQSTEAYTTDFVFTEVSTPDVVILTNVRKSGDHDLDIPETVDILGEQCKIVGFDNGVFNNNKDLWTISLPQTIQFLSEKSLFNHTLTGNGGTQTFDVDIKNNEGWTITMDVVRTGELTDWGSCLIASGSNPAKPDGQNYAEGFQFYLQSPNNSAGKKENDKLIIKTKTQKNDAWYFDDVYQEPKFTVVINYNGAQQLSVNVLKADGTNATNHNGQQGPIVFTECTIQDIKQLCTNVQSTIAVHVEIDKAAESDPFEGCTNLFDITVANGCTSYHVADRKLYNASDYVLHTLADANKADAIRNLGTLIDNTKALMDVIATSINPTGKATGLPLTTEQGEDFYVSSNADQNTGGGDNDGGGITALVDNNEGTYFHTRWGGTVVNEPHYIQVDLGANNLMNYFKFTYKPRNGSPAPTAMTVYGSNDGTNFTDVLATIKTGLPAHDSGKTYESSAIDSKKYRYLRFTVTGSDGPGNEQYGNQYFFGMLEFDLFKLTSTVEVDAEYKELGGITNDEAAEVYDNLVNALYVYNNGGTAEELQAAYNALEPLYSAVNEKKNKVEYVRELNELMPATETLIKAIATSIDPVGKATEIALTTTEGEDYYIWCNAPTANEGVDKLLDNNDGTFLHTEWNAGAVDAYQHYLFIELADVEDLSNFKFRYKARTGNANDMNMGDIPSGIKVYGLNEKGGADEELYTVSRLSQNSAYDWTSPAIDAKSYRYLRFNVTANNGYWHMAEFDLFKLTSDIEVAPEYKTFGGINNEETEAAYDCMVNAQALCSNGTAAELEAALNALQSKYDALKAKKDKMKVLNGVYHINFGGAPIFVAHSPALEGLTGAGNPGYRLFDATTTNTDDKNKGIQNEAIAAKAAGDELFTIVPNSDITGYTISAQGLYMQTTGVLSQWCVQLFDTDVNNAGVYLVEDVSEDVFKLKSNKSGTQYVNDWGPVFGNDNSNKEGLSTFTFTPVTTYTFAVSEAGFATLCLPFNVVIPEGMVAYDLAASRITNNGNVAYAYMDVIAEEGEVLKAGTPVIVKAAQGSYTLAITMDDTDAKEPLDDSLLKGNFVSQTLTQGTTTKKFIFANGTNGVGFYLMDESGTIGANKCWMEWTVPAGQAEVRSFVISFDDATGISDIIPETDENRTHLIYNISGQRLNKPQKGLNIIGNKKVIIK